MKLIDDIKGAWKHYSTQALAAGASLPAAWEAIPDDLKAALPPSTIHWVARITGIVCLAGLFGKFIDQTPKDKPNGDKS